MPHLSIRVLGPFQVSVDGENVTAFASDKVRALLVYLALSPGHPHRREALAGLLWPEFPERSARGSLRNALANLRQVIGARETSTPFVLSTRQTIQFNEQSDYWLDADAFEELVATVPPVSEGVEQAVGLVRGSFLEGFTLADASPFEEWLLLRREHFHRQMIEALDSLVAFYEADSSYKHALAHAWRRVELEPWQEDGQQQLMRLLAWSGHRNQALTLYESHRQELTAELGVEPAPETTRLFEQIRNGELELLPAASEEIRDAEPPPRLPGFLELETDAIEPPVFVARKRELARLNTHLDEALAGHGHVVFVTGGPGRGKTALLAEFGRQASEVNPDLLVTSGNCNTYSGIGDPYLPFRDIMAMLTGDVEARWLAGTISTAQARRLWAAFPLAVESLLQHGPQITGSFVAGKALLSRAARWWSTTAAEPHSVAWLHRLRRRVEHRQVDSEGTDQSHLFQQVTNLLRDLAETHPLLLILDDLQWADTASISLLFHLGRRLEGARILIAGAYRAEEVALGRIGEQPPGVPERHPLGKVLSEFKRIYGDIWLDLADVDKLEQRRFVDALLKTEPNCLGESFRRVLTEHTGGHPLFTAELLRAMQARGDLIRDEAGRWTHGPVLDWATLPARVEGVIEERVNRLEQELREILSVASVEGDDFTVQVVAEVLGMEVGMLLRRLARDLARQHRLVTEQAEVQIDQRRIHHFKFSHVLVQNYFYQQLSLGERRLLHGKIAAALENCYGLQVDKFAVQLAHHYEKAGDDNRALSCFTQAAENAHRVFANDEAYTHYTCAIEAAKRVSKDTELVVGLHLGRGLVCNMLGDFEGALADDETALRLAGSAGEGAFAHLEWRALLNLGKLWTSRDYHRARYYFQQALDLAYRMGDPAILARSLNWIGNWHLNAENPRAAITNHQEALTIFEELGDRKGLATTLDLLGIASLLGGDATASVKFYDRAIPLFQEMDDQPNLASSLTGRGHASCSTQIMLTMVPSAVSINPRRDFEEAARITCEIGSPAGEAWVRWSVGLLDIVQGRFGQALEVIQDGLDIATQIGHSEWIVGNQCALGTLYLELLAPEVALQHLKAALAQAEELQSPALIHWATGALAATYCQRADLSQAQKLLDLALSAEKPMDAMYRRYCWAIRADLALAQNEPGLALDITERLIRSAPGLSPGSVITFLWKLKGEALAALGQLEAGHNLLCAALENARKTGERLRLWQIHARLGKIQREMGCLPGAHTEYSLARAEIESLAATLSDGHLKQSFLAGALETLNTL